MPRSMLIAKTGVVTAVPGNCRAAQQAFTPFTWPSSPRTTQLVISVVAATTRQHGDALDPPARALRLVGRLRRCV